VVTFVKAGGATIDSNGLDITINKDLTAHATSTGGGLTKRGTGTLTLTGASTYTGPTAVSANGGTLKVDNNNTTTPRLANTSGITVNNGGTLLLAQTGVVSNDRINNGAAVTLAGGTFNTGGLNEGPAGGAAGSSAAMGPLTLSVNSTIDFTSGTGSNLLFASLSYTPSDVVSIRNWTGMFRTDNGSVSNDRLLFTTAPGFTDAQLASIQFYDDSGSPFAPGATLIPFNGYSELVPIPEPATIFGAIALLGLAACRERKRLAALLARRR
jgi:autotransporter-associated beta strand protein